MGRKTRAGNVKTALYEITRELVAKREYSPTKAIAELRVRRGETIKADAADIEDYGLRAIAGVVKSKRTVELADGRRLRITQFDILEFEFEDGTREKRVVDLLESTARDIAHQVRPDSKTKRAKEKQKDSLDYILEMKTLGILDMKLIDYLKSKKD